MKGPDNATAQPGSPQPGAPGHMRWDTSELKTHRCALATASVTPAEIILNFGVKRSRNSQGSEVATELVQRIALTPLTARHLMAALERVIVDHDGAPRASR